MKPIKMYHHVGYRFDCREVSAVISGSFNDGEVEIIRLTKEGKFWGWRFVFTHVERIKFCTNDVLEIEHIVREDLKYKDKKFKRLRTAFAQAYIKFGSPRHSLCKRILDL